MSRQVDQVHVLGTQPWPIGRAGTCELMLGCIGKAQSYEIMVNMSEMEDIQWYDRSELRAAVQLYQDNMDETMVSLQASFFVCSYLDLDLCLCVGRAMNWFGCIFGCFRGIWLATMPELAPGLCPIL